MSKNCSASAGWKRTTRPSGAGSSATVPNWRSGCAVISNQPTGPGVSMRPTFVSRAVGATSTEPSIPPAPRSTSCSRACAMPLRPNACSARRSLIRRIRSPVSSTRTRPAFYGSAIAGVKKEGLLRRRCRHRPVQYLNNILEQDHRAIKRRVKAKQGFREFQAARRTIQGYEAMHMIRKGQARWVSGSEVRRQIQFINNLFEVAA